MHWGWERERKDKPKSTKARGAKDRGNLAFIDWYLQGHCLELWRFTGIFVFMERLKFGIPKSAVCSNNLLWNEGNSCFLGEEELLNAGDPKAPEMSKACRRSLATLEMILIFTWCVSKINMKKKFRPLTRVRFSKECLHYSRFKCTRRRVEGILAAPGLSVPTKSTDNRRSGKSYCLVASCEGALSVQPHSHHHATLCTPDL